MLHKSIPLSILALVLCAALSAQGTWNKERYPEAEPINKGILQEFTWRPGESNRPVGQARGIFPGRVVMTRYPEACQWKGRWRLEDDQWFLPENTDVNKCCEMVSTVLLRLTGTTDGTQAWKKIFGFYHERNGQKGRGYRSGEKVAVKININNSKAREKQSNMSDATPQVVFAMVRSLVEEACVAPADIIVYDARRPIPDEILSLIWGKYPDVLFVQDEPGVRDYQRVNPKTGDYTLLQKPDWVQAIDFSKGDFQDARLIPRQVYEATYLVNLAMLKLHSYPYNYMEMGDEGQTAVTMCAKNHAGSLRAPWEMHSLLNTQKEGTPHAYSPLVDLNASPNLGAKTILYMLDGLYCGRKHASFPIHFPNAPFYNRAEPYENPEWPACLLASLDQVALESVGLDLLYAQSVNNLEPDFYNVPRILVRNNASDYLLEMADPEHAPSGTRYMQGGKPVKSLGVFEHWDGPKTMRYSRNLDPVNGKGIEFIYIPMGSAAAPRLRADNIDEIVAAMTLEEKARLLTGRENGRRTDLVAGAAGITQAIPRLGIPSIVLTDGPAGVRIDPRRAGTDRTFFATGFPVGTALACTWNPALVESVGEAIGNEVLEYGCDVLLAPGMNIMRTPLCGRNFEYYSEDPVLTGRIAAAYVNGVQRNGVGTSIKHFAVNSQETNRIEVDEVVSQRALREIYLKGFETAVREAEPWTVMSSYNRLNGIWTQSSPELLTTILRDEWGFDGAVMSDWTNEHRTSFDRILAGNELLTPGHPWQETDIIAHVKDGSLPQEILDARVHKLLELIVKTPRFKGYAYSNAPDLTAHAALTRTASTEGMVLLENKGKTLPLKEAGRIAIYGPGNIIAGGTGSGDVHKPYVVDLETGLKDAGFTIVDGTEANVALVNIARQAGEGRDRKIEDDFNLKADEKALIQRVCAEFHACGKKVIVLLNMGGVIETASWKHLPDAVLLAWQPGQEGGHSIADVLTGAQSPSGKLSMTFPVNASDIPAVNNFPTGSGSKQGDSRRNVDYTLHEEDIWVGYRFFTTYDVPVSYPFGYGLSYTSFAYSKPSVKATKDGFTARITVTNTGDRPGKEAVQLYVSAPSDGMKKPVRELKSFAKTRTLSPGQSETLSFEVSLYDLASFNQDASRWETSKGRYEVQFGASSEDIRARGAFNCKEAFTKEVHDVLKPNHSLDILPEKELLPAKADGRLPLTMDAWAWTPKPVDVENVPAAKVAVHEADGNTITVGPWIAGTRDVRLVSQFSLPVREGSIAGEFRTEGMYPREGNIWITFKKGDKTIVEQNYWLGTSDEWTDFRFPVFAPPPECDRILLSFGFHMKTHGRLYLRDLRTEGPHNLPVISDEPRLTRASRPEPLEPGKYIRLVQDGDTWWLVGTDGKPIYPLACAMYGNRSTPEETYPALHAMGFNTIANGSNLRAWKDFNEKLIAEGKEPVLQFYRIDTQIGRKYNGLMNAAAARAHEPGKESRVGAEVGGFDHALPDPFDPRWAEDVRRQVREVLDIFGEKPYFLGWMAGNERSHWNLYRYVWSPDCAVEFGKYLRNRYKNIAALNRSWGSDYASFEDLLAQRPEPMVIEGNKYEDFNAFSKIVLRTFNETILNIIHEEDPGRLVFSNRFMIHEVRGVFDNMDCYDGFDGMAINLYPSNDVWGLDRSERQYFELMHQLTGKPLMVCEWSVPARDSHLYDNWDHEDWSFPQIMRTQTLRARQAAEVQATWYNMPFMVGSHWFTWGDFDTKTRQSNRGLYTAAGAPWTELQEALSGVNTRIQQLVTNGYPAEKKLTSILQVMDTETGEVRTVKEFPGRMEAPNWTVDGRHLVYNSNGLIWRISPDGGEPELIPTGEVNNCNNDHVLSADGCSLAVSGTSPRVRGGSRVWILPLEGGDPRLVTPNAPSYLHGWSPDGKTLCYCAERNGDYDVYTIPAEGGEEVRLTTTTGLDDGPEFSPDGCHIWFNSVRTGLMQVWRMNADGTDQRQMTFDKDLNSWFPHVSPDGKKVVYIAYRIGDLKPDEHLPEKHVCLRMMTADGDNVHTLLELFGGQGTINVNSWAPDSRHIAFVSYRLE